MLPVLYVEYEPLNGYIVKQVPPPVIECVTVTQHLLEGEPEKRIIYTSIETMYQTHPFVVATA